MSWFLHVTGDNLSVNVNYSRQFTSNTESFILVSDKYNLLLLGGPSENSFSQRYLDRTPLSYAPGKFSQVVWLHMFL